MSMTHETFDFIWNGFGSKELTDSETSSFLKKVMLKKNGESRTTDITTENRTTKRISKDITKRKQTTVRMRYMRF